MEFYKILLEIMDEKSLKIPDVARLTGLSDSTLRSIITRKTKNITLEVAFKLSKGLDVSLERLNGEDSSFPEKTLPDPKTLLLENYDKLNELGKNEANKRVAELTEINKYTENTSDEISATKNNVIELNNEYDDEKFIPYNSLDEAGTTIAAHDDDLTQEEKERADKILLDYINSERLKEFNKKHNTR